MRRRTGNSPWGYITVLACIAILGVSAWFLATTPAPTGGLIVSSIETPAPTVIATPVPTPSVAPTSAPTPIPSFVTSTTPSRSLLDVSPVIVGLALVIAFVIVLLLFSISRLIRRLRRRNQFAWPTLPSIPQSEAMPEPARNAIDDLLRSFEDDLANAKKKLEPRPGQNSTTVPGAGQGKTAHQLPNPRSLLAALRARLSQNSRENELVSTSWDDIVNQPVPEAPVPEPRRVRLVLPTGIDLARRLVVAGAIVVALLAGGLLLINGQSISSATSALSGPELLFVLLAILAVGSVVGLFVLNLRLRRVPPPEFTKPVEELAPAVAFPVWSEPEPEPELEPELEPIWRSASQDDSSAKSRPLLSARIRGSRIAVRLSALSRRSLALLGLVLVTGLVAAIVIVTRIKTITTAFTGWFGNLNGQSLLVLGLAALVSAGVAIVIIAAFWYERRHAKEVTPAGLDPAVREAAIASPTPVPILDLSALEELEPPGGGQVPDVAMPVIRRRRWGLHWPSFPYRPAWHRPAWRLPAWLSFKGRPPLVGPELMELTPEEKAVRRRWNRPAWSFGGWHRPAPVKLPRLPHIEVVRPTWHRPSLVRPHFSLPGLKAAGAGRTWSRPHWSRPTMPHPTLGFLHWRPSPSQRDGALFLTGLVLLGLAIFSWANGDFRPANSALSNINASPTIIVATASPSPSVSPSPSPSLAPSPSLSPSPSATLSPSPSLTSAPSPTDIFAARRAALPQCTARANCRVYTTVPGDYLLALARYFGVDYNTLLAYNPQLQNRPNLIYSDERIFIPD